ncbi:MAG: rhomboid family intramembrane serine protease [Rhodobacterales bacterium CG_4_10_14_0_8_um_filter_70_9]|nr:MAG: rhomboid family intramembrane serine protease [Rhodobacterales bacterium CG_4_10_14_0_8_um_filter_70_9]
MKTGAPPLVWAMAGAFIAIEGVLTASDLGLAPQGLRFAAYRAFAFFDIYFDAMLAGRAVPAQLWWSLVTHAFLHGGLLHLAMNTAVFLALGAHLTRAVGEAGMLALFFGTAVAGALLFGLLADTGPSFVPMVGASGALFGFLGAMKRWEWRYLAAHDLPRRRFWSTVLALTAVNVVLSLGFGDGGGVAWQAHLGGFLAGWFAAPLMTPRRGMAIGPI